jgi:ribonucleotide reductase alpha subunit
MRVSLPAAPPPLQGEDPHHATELVQNLEELASDTLTMARADLGLLSSCDLTPSQRDLAEQLHGTVAHARHLACLLREMTEAAR